ncbi:MAG: 4-carboxymuconolactone decarboxylase [Hydrotalea flava]|nr:4-carboxymuconolactone decarboxylase [Hydrotalea flava]RWZ86012.1 MAG: 4-carboxymuconolactone decarboxylase [Hydrotalea sp. AMD]GHT74394.1 carboxymuconolactone decarboxylase [Spirochaetia bacterium]NIM38423.1 4-carboxymuconolactone decarboxylase [Hydrotalea flava]NIN03593.1 4-carboxymuconolactone decarboxylase [Hydrotalea flava]
MKHILLAFTIIVCSLSQSMSQNTIKQSNKKDTMNRIEKSKQKFEELFKQVQSVSNSDDPELMNILQRFIFGEVFYIGNLSDTTRELITITALATNQTLPQLKAHTNAALNIGVKPIEIREIIYQLAPFIGYPKVLNALDTINSVFKDRGIKLPLENEATIADSERFNKGKEIQTPIYGEGMKQNMKDLPGEFAEAVPRILTESCFGDFYTRSGLDLKTRELMIFCALATLGGADKQMGSHAVGNMKVGNDKETLLSALIQLYPYIGFPRIANAIYAIKEAKIEKDVH